jgi:hypothetical protein
LPPPAKFFNQKNFVAGGAKAEPEIFGKLGHSHKNWPDKKRKGTKVWQARVCHQHNLAPKLKIFKVSNNNTMNK